MTKHAPHVTALFAALRFQDPRPEFLRSLNDADWHRLLALSDRTHLTLIFGRACRQYLPGWVHERIGRNLADNTERVAHIQRIYEEAAETLWAAGAEHMVLKGFSQWPHFVAEVPLRMQSDLDIYCPGASLFRARDSLLKIGYELDRAPSRNRTDHLPALIRWNGWQWRGNFFDPQMPPSLELHHRFWSRAQTRFGPRDLSSFWSRRDTRPLGSICFPTLNPVDSFGFAASHALRHLLEGGLIPSHIYELAYFLHQNADNDPLWNAWLDWHEDEFRSMAAVASLLALLWFNPRLPAAMAVEIDQLPEIVPRWFRKFPDSPLHALFHRNKDALWLHLALIDSQYDRFAVAFGRLFPLWFPGINERWVQEDQGVRLPSHPQPIRKYVRYFNWFASRTARHLYALPPTLWRGLRLWSS